MSSKSDELVCLMQFLEVGGKLKGSANKNARRVARELNMCELDETRPDNARPDFMFYGKSDTQGTKVIGIEHFMVGNYSVEVANCKVSTPKKDLDRELEEFRLKHYDTINKSNRIPDEIMYEFVQHFGKYINMELKANFSSYLKSFKHSFETHNSKVDAYLAELRNTGIKQRKLYFLIDIDVSLNGLYLYDRYNGFRPNKSGYMPMLSEVVDMLEDIDKDKVDFIILSMKSLYEPNKYIVLRTGNIAKQLQKHHITVYDCVDSGEWAKHEISSIPEDSKVRHEDRLDFIVSTKMHNIEQHYFEQSFTQTIIMINSCFHRGVNMALTSCSYVFYVIFGETFNELVQLARYNPEESQRRQVNLLRMFLRCMQDTTQVDGTEEGERRD